MSNLGGWLWECRGAFNWCEVCHALRPDCPSDCRYCFETTSLPEVEMEVRVLATPPLNLEAGMASGQKDVELVREN